MNRLVRRREASQCQAMLDLDVWNCSRLNIGGKNSRLGLFVELDVLLNAAERSALATECELAERVERVEQR
jgi:hypothetical protein